MYNSSNTLHSIHKAGTVTTNKVQMSFPAVFLYRFISCLEAEALKKNTQLKGYKLFPPEIVTEIQSFSVLIDRKHKHTNYHLQSVISAKIKNNIKNIINVFTFQ